MRGALIASQQSDAEMVVILKLPADFQVGIVFGRNMRFYVRNNVT